MHYLDDDLNDDGSAYDTTYDTPHDTTRHHTHHGSAMHAGTAYAFLGHALDRQTATILNGLVRRVPEMITPRAPTRATGTTSVTVVTAEAAPIPFINSLDTVKAAMPDCWDDYVGQEPLKRQLSVYIAEAKTLGTRLPHILLNSGMPGVGKTTMARLLAATMGVDIVEVVPPFDIYTLAEAGASLDDGDILFVDEIHLLGRQQEMLLKPLEDGVVHLPSGDVVHWPDITIIGATTEGNAMLDTILDRFKIKPYFQAYTLEELALIAIDFSGRHNCVKLVTDEVADAMAKACRGTPRILDEMVRGQRALTAALARTPAPKELLEFLEIEHDGLTRLHIQYLTGLRQYFPRWRRNADDTETLEYVAGLHALRTMMRENEKGLGKIENYLITRGLVDRTPQGRRLTDAGITRAERFIAEGKGVARG